MSGPAAISAQLVDMRNVGSYKSLKLTLHVPEEYALEAIEAFGWPTGANPVPVALARLVDDAISAPATREAAGPPVPVSSPRRPKPWAEMSPAAQAGLLCGDESFRKFLSETYPRCWLQAQGVDRERAAVTVRNICYVASRSEIKRDTISGTRWDALVSEYRAWMRAPEVVDE